MNIFSRRAELLNSDEFHRSGFSGRLLRLTAPRLRACLRCVSSLAFCVIAINASAKDNYYHHPEAGITIKQSSKLIVEEIDKDKTSSVLSFKTPGAFGVMGMVFKLSNGCTENCAARLNDARISEVERDNSAEIEIKENALVSGRFSNGVRPGSLTRIETTSEDGSRSCEVRTVFRAQNDYYLMLDVAGYGFQCRFLVTHMERESASLISNIAIVGD